VRSSGDIRWRCTERRIKCPGVVHTDSHHRNVRQMADHRHPADLAAVEIASCRVQMKTRATSSRDKPGVIYEALQTLSEGTRCSMTAASSVKRALRNYKTVHHPPQGQSLSELTIDGDWATTGGTDKKPFMVYDNGVDSQARLIVFATEKCLEQLGRSSTWYMDGNFSMAPHLFLQVNTLPINQSIYFVTHLERDENYWNINIRKLSVASLCDQFLITCRPNFSLV